MQIPERANTIWEEIIAEHEAPPMSEGIREELAGYVVRPKSESGLPTGY
ncbi:MAG TPA: hypothetical protein ENJ90_04680 [Devosia sp.]|nr:hypothetical protein [Devosia sp.]